MILINLPAPQTPPVPDFTIGANLDNVTYTLRFRWNTSDLRWYVRVLDEPGVVVLMGDFRVVADWPLYRSRVARQPPGFLIVRDTSGQGASPGLSDLGGSHQLYYVTTADLATLGVTL